MVNRPLAPLLLLITLDEIPACPIHAVISFLHEEQHIKNITSAVCDFLP